LGSVQRHTGVMEGLLMQVRSLPPLFPGSSDSNDTVEIVRAAIALPKCLPEYLRTFLVVARGSLVRRTQSTDIIHRCARMK